MKVVPPVETQHTPSRMCVGCRGRDEQRRLLRVVATDAGTEGLAATLLPDPTRQAPGRGAYVHHDPACLDQALRRRAFGRALRRDGSLDVRPLQEWVEQHV